MDNVVVTHNFILYFKKNFTDKRNKITEKFFHCFSRIGSQC